MKHLYILKYALMAIVFLATTLILPGCSFIKELDTETRTVANSSHPYKVAFQRKDYSDYILNFISQKNQFILSTVNNVYIVDLKTGKIINTLNIPDSSSIIDSTYVSNNGTKFFQFTSDEMRIWSTKNWTLLKQVKATKYHPNRQSGLSNNEKLLYFADAIWSGDTYKKLCENVDGVIPSDYGFSPNNRYFAFAGHHGISITDIKERKWTGITYLEKGASQVSFRDNDSFYASYGAKLDITKGGYLPEKLGLFAVKEKNILETFSPGSRISCWVNTPESGLLVSLYNGDIYHLNPQLDIQDKWHVDDFIRSCSLANNGAIWLGGEKTGLYKANLKQRVISHEYDTSHAIYALKISSDNRYLGFTEQFPGETQVKVLYLDQ